MISSRMLLGQATSSPRAPAELSSLHSGNCSLFVLSFRLAPFRISNLEPLFAKHPGGGYPNLHALAVGSLPSSLLLITYPQAPHFHAVAHSFAQRRVDYSRVFSALRTLLMSMGVGGAALNSVHGDSAQQLGIKVGGFLRQDFAGRGDAHHLLHGASVQQKSDLRCAAVHRLQCSRSFALVRKVLLGRDRLRRNTQCRLQDSFMEQQNVEFALQRR